MKIISLKRRKDFVDLAKNGQNAAAKGLVVQTKANSGGAHSSLQVGFTATKKLGNAVVRNRIKRKLRAVVYHVMPERAKESYDYVIIGRRAALDRAFCDLVKDLKFALHSTNTHK